MMRSTVIHRPFHEAKREIIQLDFGIEIADPISAKLVVLWPV